MPWLEARWAQNGLKTSYKWGEIGKWPEINGSNKWVTRVIYNYITLLIGVVSPHL